MKKAKVGIYALLNPGYSTYKGLLIYCCFLCTSNNFKALFVLMSDAHSPPQPPHPPSRFPHGLAHDLMQHNSV